MDELRDRLRTARPSNWEHWPTVRELWPWFTALAIVALIAIPWGIRAEERNLEAASRNALTEAGIAFANIEFTGRQATIVADLPTDQQNAAVEILAAMGGVSRVDWKESSGTVASPSTTTTAPTTTMAPGPGAELFATVNSGTITLRGTVPSARTVKEVNDAASAIWGSAVVNQMMPDGTVLAHPWLVDVGEAVAALATLIDPHLVLDHEGASITGQAINQSVLDQTIERLAEVLGDDVPLNSKVSVTTLDLPTVLLLSPGDGTAEMSGTLPNPQIRRAVAVSVAGTGEELELVNTMRVSETTADVYLLHQIPDLISALAPANQWVLQFDGESLGGAVVGGKAFTGNRIKPTVAMADILEILVSYLNADPHLILTLDVHAEPRNDQADLDDLAAERAEAIADHLVRLGIEPDRVIATTMSGEGEVLRFRLIPAEK